MIVRKNMLCAREDELPISAVVQQRPDFKEKKEHC